MDLVVSKVWEALLLMLIVQVATAFCSAIGQALVVEERQESSKPDQASAYFESLSYYQMDC